MKILPSLKLSDIPNPIQIIKDNYLFRPTTPSDIKNPLLLITIHTASQFFQKTSVLSFLSRALQIAKKKMKRVTKSINISSILKIKNPEKEFISSKTSTPIYTTGHFSAY